MTEKDMLRYLYGETKTESGKKESDDSKNYPKPMMYIVLKYYNRRR